METKVSHLIFFSFLVSVSDVDKERNKVCQRRTSKSWCLICLFRRGHKHYFPLSRVNYELCYWMSPRVGFCSWLGWVRARAWCHPMNIQIYVYLSCCRQSQLLCTYVLVCNVLVQTRWGWTCWANGFASADRLKRGTIFCILGHWNGILEHTQNDDHFFSTL